MTAPSISPEPSASSAVNRRPPVAERYLTMRLGSGVFAVDILCVREIIEPVAITRIPRAQSFVHGVINLRGKVISVIDLPCRLGMGPIVFGDHTVIIVLQYERDGVEESFGVIVDEVLEVLTLEEEQVCPTPRVGDVGVDAQYLVGVGCLDEKVIFLLDVAHTLSFG